MFNADDSKFLIILKVHFFDFHHHHPQLVFGVYNLKYQEAAPQHFFSAGIHPNAVTNDFDAQLSWLKEVLQHPNCVAVGECGLDGLIDVDEKLQEEVFEEQIFLANKVHKPLIIHCVKRYSQLLHYRKQAKVPMVVHGFNKRKTIGDELLMHDFYLSFGQSVLYNVNLQHFVKNFPVNRLFLETDAADFNIADLYAKVADLKGVSTDDLVGAIKENLSSIMITEPQ